MCNTPQELSPETFMHMSNSPHMDSSTIWRYAAAYSARPLQQQPKFCFLTVIFGYLFVAWKLI